MVDYPKADPFIVNGIDLVLTGACTAAVVQINTVPTLAAYSAILGIQMGIHSLSHVWTFTSPF